MNGFFNEFSVLPVQKQRCQRYFVFSMLRKWSTSLNTRQIFFIFVGLIGVFLIARSLVQVEKENPWQALEFTEASRLRNRVIELENLLAEKGVSVSGRSSEPSM